VIEPGVQEAKKPRKEKEVFSIDFFSPEDIDEETLFQTGAATINLPKTQWKSKSRNLLPDDMHFTSKQLLRLFLKPKATLHARVRGPTDEVDEHYWAAEANARKIVTSTPEPELAGVYDADFFADGDGGMGFAGDMDEGETFADAREEFSPGVGDRMRVADVSQAEAEFGGLLRARRARPDYVNYAKTAKKVDVKKLKDNLWAKLELSEVRSHSMFVDRADFRRRWKSRRRSSQRLFVNWIPCTRLKLSQT